MIANGYDDFISENQKGDNTWAIFRLYSWVLEKLSSVDTDAHAEHATSNKSCVTTEIAPPQTIRRVFGVHLTSWQTITPSNSRSKCFFFFFFFFKRVDCFVPKKSIQSSQGWKKKYIENSSTHARACFYIHVALRRGIIGSSRMASMSSTEAYNSTWYTHGAGKRERTFATQKLTSCSSLLFWSNLMDGSLETPLINWCYEWLQR
jgi:hypothetical protein